MGIPPSKVFIYNGYDHYGGAYMLYQIGRVCHEAFGSQVFIIQNNKKERGKRRFYYPYAFPAISVEEMKQSAEAHDLFFCNPAHSRLNFGSQLNCKKVMYLQGVTSYQDIDPHFDHYVSVSQFVKDHAKGKFGMDTFVIHPFIVQSTFQQGLPWEKRRDELLVLCYKRETISNLGELIKKYKKHLRIKKVGHLSQKQLAAGLSQHKYYLTLTSVEGFGLIPLEAMAAGAAVIGFDAFGSRDYFTDDNSFVVPSGDYEHLIEKLEWIQNHPEIGKQIAEKGRETAGHFTYENFKQKWIQALKTFGVE